jgi:cysteine desulfurase
MLGGVRYLDHNATSPLCEAAREAWLDAVARWPGNPSSPHRIGARAARALEEAREELAGMLGCPAGDVVWTSGATESNNAVLQHCSGVSEGEAWVSAVEHPSVRIAARRWFAGRIRPIPVGSDGVVDVGWVEEALRAGRPAVVVVMAANNETGVLQPWREVAGMCRAAGVRFLCDAAQWLGKVAGCELGGADFVTGCAHKFGGPAGVGFVRAPGGMRPLLLGGGQEDGRRAGTENLAGIRAAVAALRDREAWLTQHPTGVRSGPRDRFEARALGAMPGASVLGAGADRLWNTSALLLPRADCRRRWVVRLDRLGFAVSTGSACSSGREKPSAVLEAMGVDGMGERMLRVSSGWETPVGDWDALAAALEVLAGEAEGGVGGDGESAG